jgi:hypothetical protein
VKAVDKLAAVLSRFTTFFLLSESLPVLGLSDFTADIEPFLSFERVNQIKKENRSS